LNASIPQAGQNAEEFPALLETLSTRVPCLRWPIWFGWRLAMRWGEDECPLKGAAMAFFGLLSVFPLLLAAVSILATTLAGNNAALTGFQSFVEQFFPGQTGQDISSAMKNAVDKIAGGTSAATVSLIALGSLIWSGRAYFATLADVLASVWPRSKPRTFWQSQLVLWSTFAGAGALWLLSTLATLAISVAGRMLDYLPPSFLQRLPLVDFASRLSSWLLTVFMFWLIYRFLPNVEGKRRRRIVWGAALLAALLWEISKIGFAKFLGNLNRYEATYGSVAGVVLTLMWIYVSSLIILLGAEAAAAYEETCEAVADTLSFDDESKPEPESESEPRLETSAL
jgi:membrane protein